MKPLTLVILCVCGIVATSSAKRNKRSAIAMAGAGGFPGFTGAFAGPGFAGFGWPFFPSPFDYRRGFMPMPWPVFPVPSKPWYEGDNVCVSNRIIEDPKELSDWFTEMSSSVDYSHESEQCQGTNTKYFCIKRVVKNGQSKMQATKYECCHGFVRDPNDAGCIESPKADQPSSDRSKDEYTIVNAPKTSSSPTSSDSKTGVEAVPIQ